MPEVLDDDDWDPLVAEALEAYRQETPIPVITARYGVNRKRLLELVDAAGYARQSEMEGRRFRPRTRRVRAAR